MKLLVLVGVSFISAWLLLVLVLAVARPRGMDFGAAKSFVPDVVRMLRNLAHDPETSRGVRVRLLVLLVYLASPVDLVPDFIPILGYADDIIAVSLVLRTVVRRAGVDALTRHWQGSDEGLDLVRRLAGLGDSVKRDSTQTGI